MRYQALFGLVAAAGLAGKALAAESAIPAAWPETRYAELSANSPFALATPPEPPKAAEHNFADGWKLSGLSQIPNREGVLQNFVVVKSQNDRARFSLIGPEVSPDGVSIVSVEFSPIFGKGSALLKKGSEVAKIEFDAADIAGQPVGAPGGAPGIARPAIPGQQPGIPGFNPGNPGANTPGRPPTVMPHTPTPLPGPGMNRTNMTNPGGGNPGLPPGYGGNRGGAVAPTGPVPSPAYNQNEGARPRVRVIPGPR